jgi:hypothetical protein
VFVCFELISGMFNDNAADVECVVVMGGVEEGREEQRQRCDRNQGAVKGRLNRFLMQFRHTSAISPCSC